MYVYMYVCMYVSIYLYISRPLDRRPSRRRAASSVRLVSSSPFSYWPLHDINQSIKNAHKAIHVARRSRSQRHLKSKPCVASDTGLGGCKSQL